MRENSDGDWPILRETGFYDQEELGLIDEHPDHHPNMADIQNPLPLEVWSRSRGHLLSKSDLWTPCVVDIAIR